MKTLHSSNLVVLALTLSLPLFALTSVASADDGEDGGGSKRYTPDMIISAATGDDHSSLGHVSSEDFTSLSAGIHNNQSWSGVGSIDTIKLDSVSGSVYSDNSSADHGIQKTSLSLNQKSSYFGFDLVSGHTGDSVNFYNGGNLVGKLAMGDLLGKGVSSGFVSFTGDANTSWDQVVFFGAGNSSFETKNWSTRVAGWNPLTDGGLQGTPELEIKNGSSAVITSVSSSFVPAAPGAPAPPITACLAFAGVLMLQALRRKSA